MRRAALAGLLALAAGAAPAGDGAPPRWQLLFFHPFRPGVLQQCRDAHERDDFGRMAGVDAADPLKAWVVQGPLQLRWRGGLLSLDGPGAPRAHPPTDLCFTLSVDGQPLVSGAVVPSQSARLLRFPTLVRQAGGGPDAAIERYELLPHFPASLNDPVPAAWAPLGPPGPATIPAPHPR